MHTHAGGPRGAGPARAAATRGRALAAVLVATTSLAVTASATAPGASAQPAPEAPEVTVTELQPLPTTPVPFARSMYDINDRGQVVGSSGNQPVLWEQGRPVELWSTTEGAPDARHINERGDVVLVRYSQAYVRRGGQVVDLTPAEDYEVGVVGLNESGKVLLRRIPTFQDAINRVDVVELWQDGTVTPVALPAPPEGLRLRLAAFSDGGQVVFEYGETVAFGDIPLWRGTGGVHVWQAGTVTRLTSSEATAAGVNRVGQVVGQDRLGGVLWSGGRTTRLGLTPVDINDRGQVAGYATVNGQRHAMLWENGRLTDLGTLGGTSRAVALNERGQVLGESTDADGRPHAFLWTNGRMVDLGLTQQSLGKNYALNDEGQAIGPLSTAGGVIPVMWTVHDDSEPPEPPAQQCFTATNQAHVQAGRAISWLVFTWAAGSGTYLGTTSQTTSLREAAPGRWDPGTSC